MTEHGGSPINYYILSASISLRSYVHGFERFAKSFEVRVFNICMVEVQLAGPLDRA